MGNKRKITALALIAVLAVSAVTGCTTYDNFKEAFFNDKGTASDTVRIGVLQPQTGNDSDFAELEIQGIELARELVPEVLGKEVELVYADTQSSLYVAESAVSDLIAKKPAVVLGSYGDTASLIAGKALAEVKIPAITITASNPLITAHNEYYFRMTFTDADQGKALADYVHDGLGLSESAIIRLRNDDLSTEMVSAFGDRLKKLTKDKNCIKTTVEVENKDKDYKEKMTQIWESKAKAVFMPVSFSIAEKFFEQAENMALRDITFIGPKSWQGNELLKLQADYPNVNIVIASDIVSKDTQSNSNSDEGNTVFRNKEAEGIYHRFITAYEKKYGSDEPPEATALAFDAYMIAVSAIEKAGSIDGFNIKEALRSTSNFHGVSGEITFDESGEPKKTINVDKIENGKFTSIYTVN